MHRIRSESWSRPRSRSRRGRGPTAAAALVLLAGAATAGERAPADPGPAHAALAAQVNQAMHLRHSDLVRVDADLTPGVPLRVVLEVRGRPWTLDLRVHSVRSERYRVFHDDGRGLREVEPGPVNTLSGEAREDPGSRVAAATMTDGIYGRIDFTDGARYFFEPVARHLGRWGDPSLRGIHVVYRAEDVLPSGGRCGTTDALAIAPRTVARSPGGPAAGGSLFIAELACDADFPYFNRWKGETEARINSVIGTMNEQYERDVSILHTIVAIIVRTSPVYSGVDPVALLNQFRDRWNSQHTNIQRDVAHLFTGRDLSGGVIGIAFVGVICESRFTGFGYSLVQSDFNSDFSCATDLSAHELGHNWNANHCNCASHTMNPFITCANQFHPSFTIPGMIAYRDGRPCLDQGQPPPANDDCGDRLINPGGTFAFSTRGATTDGPALPASCNEGNGLEFENDIWYEFIALCDGFGRVSVCDASFDTRLALYELGACPGAFITCNDDRCGDGGTRSELVFPVTMFEHFIVRLGGHGATGQGTIVFSCEETEFCPEDLDFSGVVDFADVLQVLTAWGPCGGCPEDIDDSGVVDFGDVLLVLVAWGPCP